ncbi:hypothetical protein TNCV_1611471 [Trichonephila clavipes]|nr:hypothetical protein TNCV_1611471 [Trichonephila clavipes]
MYRRSMEFSLGVVAGKIGSLLAKSPKNSSRQRNLGRDPNPYQPAHEQSRSQVYPRYPMETHLFPLTKPNQFGNNIQASTVHNLWPIPQILDETHAFSQDPDTVLITVESMIKKTTDSNEFRSKDGTVVSIPSGVNITPESVTKYAGSNPTQLLPVLPISERLLSV